MLSAARSTRQEGGLRARAEKSADGAGSDSWADLAGSAPWEPATQLLLDLARCLAAPAEPGAADGPSGVQQHQLGRALEGIARPQTAPVQHGQSQPQGIAQP